jgi:hypothetical protein
MTQLPAEAYPVAIWSANRHLTPGQVRVEVTDRSLCLWLDGLMIGVSLDADDTKLQAALNAAYHVAHAAEQYGALIRKELDQRQGERQAEPSAAAMRAATDPATPPEPAHA